MIRGSCLCGAVAFELAQAPEIMNLCHCSMCRKASGSSYGTFAHIKRGQFRWTRGDAEITRYESSPGNFRAFCKICGANLPVSDADDDYVCIPAGTFDDDPGIAPQVQIFAGSKAPWHEITDQPPSFDEFEPEDFF